MAVPSFVNTKEQFQIVIQTLHRINHFSFSLLRFERAKTRVSWILSLTVCGMQRAVCISQEQPQKH